MKPCIIVDLDGTLCDTPTYKVEDYAHIDWVKENERNIMAPGFKWVIDMIMALSDTYAVFIMTARDNHPETRKNTETWFSVWMPDLVIEGILMRPQGNFAPDHEIKQMLLTELPKGYSPCIAFDDKQANCEMFRRNGIPAIKIEAK
jgi:hypothetical protein